MPRSTQATSMIIGVAFLCFAAVGVSVYLTLMGAGGGGPVGQPSLAAANPPAGAASPDPADVIKSYTVRGKIIALPDTSGKQPLDIHHEEIPDFVGKSGKVVGMKEMIMPFANLAPGVTLGGLVVGDAVEFVFEVRWNASPRTLVTRILKLPAETALKLGPILEEGK
ncbi:MAG: copper-binding protein [Planctomycetota bacterium]|nr:copper-binding protein [Planctomycetota bacterium]